MRPARNRILATSLVLIAVGCAGEKSQIRAVEHATRPFTLAALQDSSRKHLAFILRIDGDSLLLLSDSLSIRPGTMPYRPSGGGDFRVSFLDSAGRTVSSYAMEDPRIMRIYGSSMGGRDSVTMRTRGRVEILAPADTTIACLVTSDGTGRIQRLPPATTGRLVIPRVLLRTLR